MSREREKKKKKKKKNRTCSDVCRRSNFLENKNV
jgi:hypothetical protein